MWIWATTTFQVLWKPPCPPARTDSTLDVYTRAFSVNLLQSDVEQIVPVVLARAGYEKRRIDLDTSGRALVSFTIRLEKTLIGFDRRRNFTDVN